MWKSYHIYKTDYNEFLSKVEYLKKNFIEGSNAIFFTLYTDMKGPHFRLRIRSSCIRNDIQISKELIKVFTNKSIEERIYDPEVIKYGKNLQAYEHFSTVICDFLITNKNYSVHKIETVNLILGLMKNILEEFDLYSVTQIEDSIDFWSNSKNFFRASIDQHMYSQLNPVFYFSEFIKDFVKGLCISTASESKELCFNLIHLAVNRFNFNLKDECLLYYKLYELKEEK
jgi:hypothetical protein